MAELAESLSSPGTESNNSSSADGALSKTLERVREQENNQKKLRPKFPWQNKFLRIMGVGIAVTAITLDSLKAHAQEVPQPTPILETAIMTENDLVIESTPRIEVLGPGENTTFIDFIPGADTQQLIRQAASVPEGEPGRIRTCDLLLRRQSLSPTELLARGFIYCTAFLGKK